MSVQQDLIYDIGMHQGEDTDFYLQKGFRVVGVEADPEWAAHCRRRFAEEIAEERLFVLEGAIVAPEEGAEEISFYKNLDHSVWGTIYREYADRFEEQGTRTREIRVPTLRLGRIMDEYGIPYYMKIDIEGADFLCLDHLARREGRPTYLSLETEKRSFALARKEFKRIASLGYSRFKIINQAMVDRMPSCIPAREGKDVVHRFPFGSTGPFGKELPGKWHSLGGILLRYRWTWLLHFLFGGESPIHRIYMGRLFLRVLQKVAGRPIPGWFDTHAFLERDAEKR